MGCATVVTGKTFCARGPFGWRLVGLPNGVGRARSDESYRWAVSDEQRGVLLILDASNNPISLLRRLA